MEKEPNYFQNTCQTFTFAGNCVVGKCTLESVLITWKYFFNISNKTSLNTKNSVTELVCSIASKQDVTCHSSRSKIGYYGSVTSYRQLQHL